jgi:tetratricopeptide (TPR) repeat protein
MRDVEGAIQELDSAIQYDPESIEYILLRGDYLFRFDKHQLACDDFTKVIERSDDIDDLEFAYGWRAHCYEYLGKVDKAIADVDWQIVHGFIHDSTYAWRASLKMKIGDIEDAISNLTTAHQMAPDAEDYLLKRAHAYYASKRYSEALNDLNQILTFKERLFHKYLAAVFLWRAKTHYRLGMMTEALADLNEYMRLNGKNTFTNISDCLQLLETGD